MVGVANIRLSDGMGEDKKIIEKIEMKALQFLSNLKRK